MNPRMAGIMCVFQVAWVYYRLLITSRPLVFWNLIAIVINVLTLGAFLHFRRKESRQSRCSTHSVVAWTMKRRGAGPTK